LVAVVYVTAKMEGYITPVGQLPINTLANWPRHANTKVERTRQTMENHRVANNEINEGLCTNATCLK